MIWRLWFRFYYFLFTNQSKLKNTWFLIRFFFNFRQIDIWINDIYCKLDFNIVFNTILWGVITQGGGGHWAVYWTSPQSYIFLFVRLRTLGTWFWSGRVFKLSIQTYQLLIVIYRRGNFVYDRCDVLQLIGHCLIPLDH